MTHDQMRSLLRLRFHLTGQSFNAETVDAWMETSLGQAEWYAAMKALRAVAESGTVRTIQVGDICKRLPIRVRTPEPEPTPSGPIVAFADGIKIARAGYIEQRIELGDTVAEAEAKATEVFRRFAATYLDHNP